MPGNPIGTRAVSVQNMSAPAAKSAGVEVATSTQAHAGSALDRMRIAVDQTRRGRLEAADVINTRPLTELRGCSGVEGRDPRRHGRAGRSECHRMSRRRPPGLRCSIGGAAAVALAALGSARGEAVQPDRVVYDVKVSEDPAVKACVLALAIKGSDGETVDFQLIVARTKRDDAMAGPAVFGFTIAAHDAHPAPQRNAARRAFDITSAAFISERYTAGARPRTAPFADGSWVASTLDTAEGGELVDAAASGKFQIAYTRTRPIAARVLEVTSAPPLDVLLRFSGCIDGLQAIE
jgi:hypothetical protein